MSDAVGSKNIRKALKIKSSIATLFWEVSF
jgi:hypothetical protein